MADLFDLRVGGAGWHLTSHLIAIAALFVACFAITGYITYRDESIPVKALDKDQDADDDIKVDNVTAKSLDVSGVNVSSYLQLGNGGFIPIPTVARTALTTADGATVALTKNTHYTEDPAGDATYTLPTAANSTKGDFITMIFIDEIANTKTAKFGTAGQFFDVGSMLMSSTRVSAAGNVSFANGTTNDFLNIIGATNGDGGIGTEVRFYFNGSNWVANAVVFGQGTLVTVGASTFADA